MPLTPFDPVPSHASAPQPTEEDYKQIVALMKSDPNTARGILSNLTPQESQGFNAYMNTYMKGGSQDAARARVGIGGADDVTPALFGMGAATGLGSTIGQAAKSGAGAARDAVGRIAKNKAVRGVTYYGASQMLPPGHLRTLGEFFAMMEGMGPAGAVAGTAAEELAGARAAQRGVAETIPAMSEAEYLAQTGHPRLGTPEYTPKPIGLREPTAAAPKSSNLIRQGNVTEPLGNMGSPSVGERIGGAKPTTVWESDPENLIRQGNVTNPGPNGTGSPSVRMPTVQRRSPSADFDETSKREVMFGGARPNGPKNQPPNERPGMLFGEQPKKPVQPRKPKAK